MIIRPTLRGAVLTLLSALMCGAVGCEIGETRARPVAQPLGSLSDPVWQNQELNAEHSDFVVHEHEFAQTQEFLNTAGEDHVKQIAARLAAGHDAQVLVERSRNSALAATKYQYRVHPNPELDMRRREIIVRSLTALGIQDAEARVVVAPALAPKYRAGEPAATYTFDQSGSGYGGGGAGASFRGSQL